MKAQLYASIHFKTSARYKKNPHHIGFTKHRYYRWKGHWYDIDISLSILNPLLPFFLVWMWKPSAPCLIGRALIWRRSSDAISLLKSWSPQLLSRGRRRPRANGGPKKRGGWERRRRLFLLTFLSVLNSSRQKFSVEPVLTTQSIFFSS